jgi:hypothetical protein
MSEDPQPKRVVLKAGQTAQLIGYKSFALMASAIYEERGRPAVSAKTIANYYDHDRRLMRALDSGERKPQSSRRLPQPVAEGDRGIPLWLPFQVAEWVDNRPGEGNRTRGEARRRVGVA